MDKIQKMKDFLASGNVELVSNYVPVDWILVKKGPSVIPAETQERIADMYLSIARLQKKEDEYNNEIFTFSKLFTGPGKISDEIKTRFETISKEAEELGEQAKREIEAFDTFGKELKENGFPFVVLTRFDSKVEVRDLDMEAYEEFLKIHKENNLTIETSHMYSFAELSPERIARREEAEKRIKEMNERINRGLEEFKQKDDALQAESTEPAQMEDEPAK